MESAEHTMQQIFEGCTPVRVGYLQGLLTKEGNKSIDLMDAWAFLSALKIGVAYLKAKFVFSLRKHDRKESLSQ